MRMRFVRDRLVPRFARAPLPDDVDPLVVIATDGELYGHHQPLREHFLARLVGATAPAGPAVRDAVARARPWPPRPSRGLPTADLRERTSWSCHHGVARWAAGCACVADVELEAAPARRPGAAGRGHRRGDRGGRPRTLPGAPDPWAARDAYVDVVIGATPPAAFADAPARRDGRRPRRRPTFLALMEAQRWRLSMFASCAWFWESPERIETLASLRAATRAARLVDGLAGTGLERRLGDDLRPLTVG